MRCQQCFHVENEWLAENIKKRECWWQAGILTKKQHAGKCWGQMAEGIMQHWDSAAKSSVFSKYRTCEVLRKIYNRWVSLSVGQSVSPLVSQCQDSRHLFSIHLPPFSWLYPSAPLLYSSSRHPSILVLYLQKHFRVFSVTFSVATTVSVHGRLQSSKFSSHQAPSHEQKIWNG